MDNETEDVLAELPAASELPHYSPAETHLKTYTAGEDGSRLKEMAKEFGLQRQRNPRRQVRAARTRSDDQHNFRKNVVNMLLDPTFMDVRMRAVWTLHGLLEEEDREQQEFYQALQDSWEQLPEEEGGDVHAQGIGGSLTSAVLGIIKAMVGPAVLYLPHGFAVTGYVVAIPIMAAATFLYLYSANCLLDCWKLESENNDKSGSINGISAEQMPLIKRRRTILSYPELAYRGLGTAGESLIKTGIALMQSGVCLTYLIFVPQNLHTSALQLFGWNVRPELWLIVMVIIQIPLSWIRDIRKFTLTNLLANTLILYGLITCLAFAFGNIASEATSGSFAHEWWHRLTHLSPFQSSWFLFIGTSVLLFEGSITLLVPLQEAVQTEEDRAKFPTVYRRVILCIIAFYTVFGITCWMSFGDSVRTVLTTSLPPGTLATTVQFAYSIAVIFTFPLQNFPCLEIACHSIAKHITWTTTTACCFGQRQRQGLVEGQQYQQRQRRHVGWCSKRNVISSFLVCMLAIVAAATMESLDKVVSLMGSLLGCPIAFVFPPLIHSQLDPSISRRRRLCNNVVAVLGVVAMVLASIATLVAW